MRSVRQLLRQPLKTAVGVALMTLAAAIVCLCVGQALAAQTTKAALDERFSTVAIPLVQEHVDGSVDKSSFLVDAELFAWLDKMQAQHPDIIRQSTRHGFLSAYIPELMPLNFTKVKYFDTESTWYDYQEFPDNMLCSSAMLVITLDQVSEPEPVITTCPVENLTRSDFGTLEEYNQWLAAPETEKMTITQGYTIQLTGTVTGAVTLPDGYRDPTGRYVRLTFTAPTLEQVQALNLVTGEQYIVYGMDYVDQHWKLISDLNADGGLDHMNLEEFNPVLLRVLSESEKRSNAEKAERWPQYYGHMKYVVAIYNTKVNLTQKQYEQMNTVTMTLDIPVPLIPYEEIRNQQTGELLELRPKTQITCIDAKGETVTYSFEEYTNRYRVPTIARLEGNVEDFLHSSDGALWKNALAQSAISNQAFPIIGVDRMDYLADFSLLRSQIVAGRDFTQEERQNGSRVCIIQDSLAEANGLSVGDTITLNLYTTDAGLPGGIGSEGLLLLPPASSYYAAAPFAETAEYTIVGLWHGKSLWPDVAQENEFAFSPNTIFVPKSSVRMPMEESDSILFNTLVLQNGKIEAFHQLVRNAGYAGRFKYYDQNYSTIAANFHNYEALGRQMLAIGAVIYTVLLLLFLLLYPGSKRSDVGIMQSFGAHFFRRAAHVMVSSLGIVIPASLLGGWIGGQLWDNLVEALQTTAESAVALQIEPGTLLWVSLAQLVFAVVLTICVALFVAAPRKMASRR